MMVRQSSLMANTSVEGNEILIYQQTYIDRMSETPITPNKASSMSHRGQAV